MGKFKHGYYGTRLYKSWEAMKSRCYRKSYRYFHRYGGRGIVVCDEWKNNAVAFIEWSLKNGYSDQLTLDRINNDGNYEPSNCRWVTRQENNLNRALPKNNKSGYRGISWNNTEKCWKACLQYNNKLHNIGNFKNINDAVCAYNEYVTKNNLPHQLSYYEPKETQC